jgi:beta-galactosidase
MADSRPSLHLRRLWHGGDYNPEQWLETPEVLEEDVRLMQAAGINEATLGVFSWSMLEPEEGRFEFGWLDDVMDRLARHDIEVTLATPSGARPAWLAQRYPEVLRVTADRRRRLYGERHNHCPTAPAYRTLTQRINRKLAERYGGHAALKLWHISNEFSGDCHCDLCQEAFRAWLRERYHTLEALNHAWWTRFWSHTYTTWDQIESPSPLGTGSLQGLNLDWKRFVTDQTIDFMLHEAAPLRELTPSIPITTNLMYPFAGLDYARLSPHLDVVSWDSYPRWHSEAPEVDMGQTVAFAHDLKRSLGGGRPFLLMESTPSVTNWQRIAKLKRPGMHLLSSLQAVAHGSDSVQYFQWRKSRGGPEKFHGAVVDHVGHAHTRVFADVAEVGQALTRLQAVTGTRIHARAAVIMDWENWWAIDGAYGPRQEHRDYLPTCQAHHRPFWEMGIPVDVVSMEADFSRYRLVAAPMLYMVRPGVADRLRRFVEDGGTLVLTYWSGIVDEADLCFLGGAPGPLRTLAGVWAEEIDALRDDEANHLVPEPGNALGLTGSHPLRIFCERIHPEGAQVLARYSDDFYAGEPVLTRHEVGAGRVYYLAARTDGGFLRPFYQALAAEAGLTPVLPSLPPGVTATVRTDGHREWVFLLNFNAAPVTVPVEGLAGPELLHGQSVGDGPLTLGPFGVGVFERPAVSP